tara:strand:- start:1714 stop:1986 length:273 start_codon:yes stop_codon:yes gene_type:complete
MADLTNNEFALELLRNERNIILKRSDKYLLSDFPQTEEKKQEWILYRQALRNLTVTQTPTLSEDGDIQNVTWPVDPNGNSGPDSLLPDNE